MKPRTEEHFKSELEAARKALRDNGRDVSVGDRVGEEAGISCDFELPYSSLPTIRSEKWQA